MAHHIEKTIHVKIPAINVWGVLKDFGSIEKTSASVEFSPIISEIRSGVGTKRKCHFYDKSSVIEEIIDYQEDRSFKMELSEFSMPLKSMIAELTVTEIDKDTCKISMSMDFIVKGGPLGWILGLLVLRPVLTNKVLKNELFGLAYHTATGETVGRKLPPITELTSLFA
jgi:hypothetical protein